jgi:hypothetical protein
VPQPACLLSRCLISIFGWNKRSRSNVFRNVSLIPLVRRSFLGVLMLSARLLARIAFLAAVLVGSFFTTLWLTEPDISDVDRLAGRSISDDSELSKAAQEIGLRPSERMRGYVDLIMRLSKRDVSATGWVADTDGDASPANVLVFVSGAAVGATQTKGERPDVTQALHLRFGSEKNTSFTVNFSCRTHDQPIIIGIGRAKNYVKIESGACP